MLKQGKSGREGRIKEDEIVSFPGVLKPSTISVQGVEGTNFIARMRDFASAMGSKLSMIGDLTYPSTAMFSGRAFNR